MGTNTESFMGTTFCIVGNPNCGKTTLFNALTGAKQEVGNWPGVTVEKKFGFYQHQGQPWQVVDLPGIYALDGGRTSEDERVARDYILSREASVVVNIVDAATLERNLYLTSQLLEMGVLVVIAINMMDIAKRRRITVDIKRLERAMGCTVVALVASRKRGLDALMEAVRQTAQAQRHPTARPGYGPEIERYVEILLPKLKETALEQRLDPRWMVLRLLEEDPLVEGLVTPAFLQEIRAYRAALAAATGEDPDILIADGRYAFVGGLVEQCVHHGDRLSRTLSDRIDRVVLNRFLGLPIFFAMIYLMFTLTINIGGTFIDFFDQAVGTVLVDGGGTLLRALSMPEAVTVILADGLGGGIRTIATFIPIIGFLYLFLSFLEDSGYMARAAFVMDRGMRAIGLPGKAFVPLIVGFGCNVPAIMATRTLEHRRDRILTMMMAPFMSCGARLPVYALFAAAFFPTNGQNIVFILYLAGIAFAVGTGVLLKRTLLMGEAAHFVMELPPYHLPTLTTVALRAWHRLRDFILRAGQVIVPMVVVLSILGAMGTDGRFNRRDSDTSMLARMSQSLMPVFHPMGLTEDNWPAAVGLFSGIFAKEVVVGTLNTLYAGLAATKDTAEESEKPFDLAAGLWGAVLTIPANLADSLGKLTDPLGLDVGFVADAEQAATTLEVEGGMFGAMTARFDGVSGAFAYLLLVLLYAPCVAALGTISHEAGWRWAVFSALWGTGIGYITAVVFYQTMTFARDPQTASLWIGAGVSFLILAFAVMRLLGQGVRRPVAETAN